MYPPQWCLTHPSDPNKCLVSGFVCDVLMASSLECNSCVDCSYYFKDAAQISLSERTFESGVGDEKKVCGRGKQVATELENVALAMALVGTRELGQEVYIALTKADTGRGIIAGVCVAFIAIIADRMIGAWVAKRKREYGLD